MSAKGKSTNQQTGPRGKQTSTPSQETKKTSTGPTGSTRTENRGAGRNSPQVQKTPPITPGLDDSEEQKVIKDLQDKIAVLKKERVRIFLHNFKNPINSLLILCNQLGSNQCQD